MRKTLKESIDNAQWEWLKPHLQRGTLLLIAFNLDLAEVAYRISQDDTEYIRKLMNGNFIKRPSDEHIEKWDKTPEREFRFIIVQPYVLMQEIMVKQF